MAKDKILQVDDMLVRYALTKDGILSAGRRPNVNKDENDDSRVKVVDANVKLFKKVINVSRARLLYLDIVLSLLMIRLYMQNLIARTKEMNEFENCGFSVSPILWERPLKVKVLQDSKRWILKLLFLHLWGV